VTEPSTHQAEPTPGRADYRERLRTPLWWYAGGVGVAVLLAVEFALAVSGWLTWVPFVVLIPLSVLVVLRMSSGRLVVTDGTLRAGDRTLPLDAVERAIQLSPAELRRLVGRHGDPSAFVWIRSWIGPGLQLVLRPQAAPEPYWVVSTRHPDRLLTAIGFGRP
jgi:hypothetical protein